MGQLGIRAANVVTFVLCCFLVAGVVNRIIEDQLAPDYTSGIYEERVEGIEQHTWDERKVILDRNLFGAEVAKAPARPIPTAPPPPPPVQTPLVETRLPLKLLGTMAAEPMRLSTAVIQNTRAHKHEVVQVGDHIKEHESVIVLAIEPRRVILQNGGKREELVLEEKKHLGGGGTPDVSAALKNNKSNARSRRRTSRTPRARRTSSRRTRTARDLAGVTRPRHENQGSAAETHDEPVQMARRAQELLSSARILPSYDEGGAMNGVNLSQIEPGSILDELGFEAGDIRKINGEPITSPDQAMDFQALLASGDDIEVEFCQGADCRIINVPADRLK